MPPSSSHWVVLGGTIIELFAAIVIAWHVIRALAVIISTRSSDRARLIIAEGVLAALSFSVAGTLLKTIALESWPDIRLFAFVLLLRTLLKRVFQWEQRSITRRTGISLTPH